ncbi:hypothetical protein FRC17_003973 [Serendipita sp. 399]|nr:hypothetical protein FRC17_003973 [Serendipita sp. 399]
MLKRWTTNTAPDHQPKPITAQLVMPGGVRRKSTQQPPIAVLADHPHAAQQGPRRRTLSASDLSGTGGKNAPWYHPSSNRRAANRMTAESGAPPWGYQGSNGHEYPMHAQSEMHLPQEMFGPSGRGPAANIYFSRKRDPYGAFRLDSEHPVSWAGIEAPTALHWYESGRFEHVGKGLGTMGMQTGWTRPSTQPLPSVGRRSGSRIGQASKMLKGLLGKNDHGLKESRLEFARAHTEASDAVLRARTSRELMRLVTQNRMEGYERNDWMMIYRSKLDEILFLKFTQHDELGVMLLNTGFAPIIFNNHDPELGDGGDANVASNNGRNELGYSLMRVREMLRQRMDAEREGDYGGEDEDDE